MYQLNAEKMYFDIADDLAVVINFTTGMYYGMDLLASAAFQRIIAGAAPDAVKAAVLALPGCPDDLAERFDALVEMLVEKEILIPGETTDAFAPFDAEKVLGDGFALACDEFAEVQDLLLADPVHDVDVGAGWPIVAPKEE